MSEAFLVDVSIKRNVISMKIECVGFYVSYNLSTNPQVHTLSFTNGLLERTPLANTKFQGDQPCDS